MNKQELLAHTKTYVKSTDGYFYVMTAKNFLALLKIENSLNTEIILPHKNALVRSMAHFKKKLTELTTTNMTLHGDVYVVLVKQPDEQGNLKNFLFDAFIFNGVKSDSIEMLRKELKEKPNKGLFKSFSDIKQMLTKNISPYYARLVPVSSSDTLKGMFILKKFY